MVLFQEINVFLQPTWKNRTYLLLQTLKLQEVLLEKVPQFLPGSNELDAPASNTDGFLSRDS
jgi:hypothetical protein